MIVDGKKIAEEMLAEVAKEVKKFKKPPRLAAVLVNPVPEAQPRAPLEVEPLNKAKLNLVVEPLSGLRKFLELKKKAAEKVGVDFRLYEFPAEITTQKLRKEIVRISKAAVNDGVIIELPLPKHLNAQYLLNAIPPEKDVDVLSEKSQGAFFVNRSAVLPPAVEAVKTIFETHAINPKGKDCAMFGYGLLVGRQVSHWLATQGATVSIINEFTPNPERWSLDADIIVSGVGKSGIIRGDMVKENATIIDFGIGSGDADFESASKKAGLITPVPGGVGPIVVAAVFKNLMALVKQPR